MRHEHEQFLHTPRQVFFPERGSQVMSETVAANEQLRRYVETHHIDMIPAAVRHGRPWHQFAFWWGGNVNVFNVVLGAVVVSFGLSLWWALIAIAAGTLIGALLIAVGFIAAQFVIQAQAMQGVTGAISIPQWILILTVPAVVIGIFGYR